MRSSLLVGGALLLLSRPAYAEGPVCGFDCSDNIFTACNDDFPTTMPGGAMANCSASLGSCAGEAFCASFGDNFQANAFPLSIPRIFLVAASDQAMDAAMQFDLEIYQENGQANPGPQIGSTINLNIPGSQTAATVINFTALGLTVPTLPNPGRFRICLRKQFNQGHNICLDDTNPPSMFGRNWAHVRVAADPNDPCGSAIIPTMWYSADGTGSPLPGFPGINGDFILRPEIAAADPAGLPGGGMCPETDAGMPGDGGLNPIDGGPDAGDPDVGMPMDAMTPDTGTPIDAGEMDAAIKDAAPTGDAPTITAISPDEGQSTSRTDVVVTGTNFVAGLTLRIGAIQADAVQVAGSTTIQATVPQGIAGGTFDVVVTNPDGQAAILPMGFTVRGVTTNPGPPVDEGCGCSATEERTGSLSWMLLLGLLWWRRRPKAVRG